MITNDHKKSKKQLIRELIELRVTVAALEKEKGSRDQDEAKSGESEREFEVRLQESETRFRQLFEGMSSGVAVYEAVNDGDDFIFKDYNRAAELMDKIDRTAVLGRRVTEAFPGVEEFGLLKVLRQVWKTGCPNNQPVSVYKDQRIFAWRENYVYKLPTGEIIAIYNDVSEKKKAEEELTKYREHLEELVEERTNKLKKSEALFRAIFDSSKDCVAVFDRDYNYLYVNQAASDHARTTHGRVIGRNIREGLGQLPELMRLWINRLDRIFESGEPMHFEDFGKIDEKTVYSQSVLSPILDANGETFAVGLVYRDITDRKKAEEDLREKIKELEIFYGAAVNRELKMEELRKELKKLRTQIHTDENTDRHR